MAHRWMAAAAALILIAGEARSGPAPGSAASLADAYRAIHAARMVDLTHAFAPGIPHWKGFPDEVVRTPFTQQKDGFTAQVFTHVGQWGTHVDAPAHFHQGLDTVDTVDPAQFILPLVVLDIHRQAAANPDYQVSMADVRAWEARHGLVPAGAFVALRTDWSRRWPSQAAFQNKDRAGVFHYPGWSLPVLKYLYETRHIAASGHETSDTDPGFRAYKDDFSLESYVLGLDHFQIEFLANLDKVPEAGALVMVAFPKAQGGTGFPARVVAIVPR